MIPRQYDQNFYKDYWNIFDFVTVCGSAIDAFIVEFGGVSVWWPFRIAFRGDRLTRTLKQYQSNNLFHHLYKTNRKKITCKSAS